MASTEIQTEDRPGGLASEARARGGVGQVPASEPIDRFQKMEDNVRLEVHALRLEVHEVRLEVEKVRVEMVQVAGELRVDMANMKTDLRAEIREDLMDLKRSMHRWLAFGMSFMALLVTLLAVFG